MSASHISVFKNEAIDALNIQEDGIYVDATLGRAGHSLAIAKKLKKGKLICFDLDQQAILESQIILKEHLDKVTFIHSNFADVQTKLLELGIKQIDGILFDLGVSSPQLDTKERGFSYRFDSKLDMRMNQQQPFSAYDVVNSYSFDQLAYILHTYGEEKFAKQIARSIEKTRPIETTGELVDIIKSSLPAKVLSQKGHPAKRTFQAIRIEVNKELDSIEISLRSILPMIKQGGRIVVITFHSLEDRLVKQIFNEVSRLPKINKRLPQIEIKDKDYIHITKKVINVSEQEVEDNFRSHSAKLRILERK